MSIDNKQALGTEIQEDTRKKKVIPGPRNGRINTVETSIAEKGISGFHAIPVKVAAIFHREIEETILNFLASKKSP